MSGTWYGGVIPGTTGFADADAPGVAGSTGLAFGTGTSQHGIAVDTGGSMNGNPFATLWNWLNTPFKTPLSATDMFLLIGIVLVSIILWNIILFHIRIAAETI